MFGSPSAWATHCKRLVNPAKKSGCGWASVRYKGQRLDQYKAAWLRRHQPHAPSDEVGTQRRPQGGAWCVSMGVPEEGTWGGSCGDSKDLRWGVPSASGSGWCPQGQTWVSPNRRPGDWGGVSRGPHGGPQGEVLGCPRAWGFSVGFPKEVHQVSMGVPIGVPKEVRFGVLGRCLRSLWMSLQRCLRSPLVSLGMGLGRPPRCPQGNALEPQGAPTRVPHPCHRRGSPWGPGGGHGPQPLLVLCPRLCPVRVRRMSCPKRKRRRLGTAERPHRSQQPPREWRRRARSCRAAAQQSRVRGNGGRKGVAVDGNGVTVVAMGL